MEGELINDSDLGILHTPVAPLAARAWLPPWAPGPLPGPRTRAALRLCCRASLPGPPPQSAAAGSWAAPAIVLQIRVHLHSNVRYP